MGVTLNLDRLSAREGFAALIEALGGPDQTRLVGGVVRDTLLGLDPADVDLATRLLPDDVLARLKAAGIRAVPTGIAHGTVTAVLPSGPIEVTTLRHDVSTDGRHAVVAFTDAWDEDAARRDFTMNALYADPVTGAVFDSVCGLADLKARVVRFIGDRGVRTQQEARDYAAARVLPAYALHGYGMYAIERLSDGAWLGNAGLVRRDGLPGPDIGYAVLSEFAGQGYAGEAARAVFTHARGALGLHDLYGITDLDNVVSGKILLGLGMQERGVIQLPGIDTPSRLYATLGAAEV